MANNLVIVESPAKVKTIKKFLGPSYEVAASMGHVRDLPKSSLGIDVEGDFEPKYITIRGKGELLASLRKSAKKAKKIYLATDPDREGEAISWHLVHALRLDLEKVSRITFHEITKKAVKEALKRPRPIDQNRVDAQQARRMLDRMVGYKISPLLWSKIKSGLSAGRVQSVALRMLCDREEEISAFEAREYWTLEARLQGRGGELFAKYQPPAKKAKDKAADRPASKAGEEREEAEGIPGREEMDALLAQLSGRRFVVESRKEGSRSRKAPLPFTTSTLQQEASRQLGFAIGKTMRVAQQLYEGVSLPGEGSVGLITYLRTDSVRVAQEAREAACAYIQGQYGETYAKAADWEPPKGKKGQDAHEAIRPTDVQRRPEDLKEALPRDLYRLYQLIWRRFVAARMEEARFATVSVHISASEHKFSVSASRLVFDGYKKVYQEDKEESGGGWLPEQGQELELLELLPAQHFTQPPAHYSEASLVRALEEYGIGRPSTYAPIIVTLLARRYILREEKNLYVTELGEAVNQIMKQAFAHIVDLHFTANMETLLDGVEEGDVAWKAIVKNFYPDLEAAVAQAGQQLEKISIADEETEEICEHCGRNMVVKYGRHGKFLACPGFPECKNAKPYLEKAGAPCPVCGKDLLVKKTKKGRRYFGCSAYPECSYMSWKKPENPGS